MATFSNDYAFHFLNIVCLENWVNYSEYLEHKNAYGTCDINPMFAHQYDLVVELNLTNALSNERVVGLGEIGLDWSKKVRSKLGVHKSLVFREILAHSANSHFSGYAIRDF